MLYFYPAKKIVFKIIVYMTYLLSDAQTGNVLILPTQRSSHPMYMSAIGK